ncbi:Protein adenylyltransferase SelO [Austwickia sp. TVS 96-490-7B]|uniref:protein adenylyltransferase SelO n=1 Tax=Austwickia sp. TVS 96-490-7B TaxID=2830843 RepID=UPI001DF3ED36|nr:YdiU family protein [Austwickia sp. TVS 96-490-7B]MBW3086724.1 Protein adenylyltransferase SelO [Austwickia sp. TVS 96-490-7B]
MSAHLAGPFPFVLEHQYADDVPALSTPWRAMAPPRPQLVVLNTDLAGELGLDPEWLASPVGLDFLTGQVPTTVPTAAQAYAGHQFGAYSPLLGDGRALLLGEVVTGDGARHDLHLKGSGPTPYARRGDGRAVLSAMLREHVIGEALHALGVPTTRALAVVTTGEEVVRDTPHPGAILCRVAASHLRVGTFQYAAARGDVNVVSALADHAIRRHYPQLMDSADRYVGFYEQVVSAQAALVAAWMGVGFVHGVMNTDNTTISGQSIDFGPCAFLDRYDPAAVFSSIDVSGRYAFGHQPGITQWNLARLGEALLPLLGRDEEAAVSRATEVLSTFPQKYRDQWVQVMSSKLALPTADPVLIRDLMVVLEQGAVDFTVFFRALATGEARSLFSDSRGYDGWVGRWRSAVGMASEGDVDPMVAAAMDRVNPAYVPRHHLVEEALAAATGGDISAYARLVRAVSAPWTARADWEDLAAPPPVGTPPTVTFCGT